MVTTTSVAADAICVTNTTSAKPGWPCVVRSARGRIALAALMVFAPTIARATDIGSPIFSNGYTFVNFDFPGSGTAAGTGTNANGIGDNGAAVGFAIGNDGAFTNFVRNADGTTPALNLTGANPMAFGINGFGDVVGQQDGAAFFLPHGGTAQSLAVVGPGSTGFGINDFGNIVGQFSNGNAMPGFFLTNHGAQDFITINAPSGPNTVNAQGVNTNRSVVGFYVGTDGQDHGFTTNINNAHNGAIAGTPVADPTIPNVPGEPGATFVFSQLLGVNDSGIVAGYYGDSTTSQHGFLYNSNNGQYTFLDDPAAQFNNGVEVTQITGINNSGEIAGFYSDAAGVFHGFEACPAGAPCPGFATPEPASFGFGSLGLGLLGLGYLRRRWAARR